MTSSELLQKEGIMGCSWHVVVSTYQKWTMEKWKRWPGPMTQFLTLRRPSAWTPAEKTTVENCQKKKKSVGAYPRSTLTRGHWVLFNRPTPRGIKLNIDFKNIIFTIFENGITQKLHYVSYLCMYNFCRRNKQTSPTWPVTQGLFDSISIDRWRG